MPVEVPGSSEGLGLILRREENRADAAPVKRERETLGNALKRSVVEGEDEVLVLREALGLVICVYRVHTF